MSNVRDLGPVRYNGVKKHFQNIVHTKKSEHFDLSAALLSKFDILDNIFSYLSYKDLCSVAQINELWRNSVELVVKKRLRPNLFTYGLACHVPESVHSKPMISVLFIKCNDMKLNHLVCLHKDHKVEARKSVIESIQDDLLTAHCPIIAITCRKLLSSFTSNILLHGIAFPCIPHINISIFKIGDPKKKISDIFSKNISDILSKNIYDDSTTLCLLAFCISPKKYVLHELIYQMQQRQPTVPFALGGGFVRGMQTFNTQTPDPYHRKDDYLCLAFTKRKDVDVDFNAYSIIIPETEEEIEQYFFDLKSHYTARKYGVAFRITCTSVQNQVAKTVKLFKKHFPKIDLLGFDGDGEIGWDCYKIDETSEPKRRNIGQRPKIFHCFTTVIVVFTWGKIVKESNSLI